MWPESLSRRSCDPKKGPFSAVSIVADRAALKVARCNRVNAWDVVHAPLLLVVAKVMAGHATFLRMRYRRKANLEIHRTILGYSIRKNPAESGLKILNLTYTLKKGCDNNQLSISASVGL